MVEKLKDGNFCDEKGFDVMKSNKRLEMVYGTSVFGLAMYGSYNIYKSISGFLKRKKNPDKELQKEIRKLRKKYPEYVINSYVLKEEYEKTFGKTEENENED